MAHRNVRPRASGGNRPAAATLIDVAQRAGVSHATVSRVLAGVVKGRPRTAEAVARAVEELGYRADSVARSLRTRTTLTIGVVVDDLEDPLFPALIQAVDVAACAAGYSIVLGSATDGQARALVDVDSMLVNRVDGLIVAYSQPTDATWGYLLASGVPTVLVNAECSDVDLVQIGSDNGAGARLAAQHLVDLGHRRIAYVCGPKGSPRDLARVAGFRATCRAAGLPVSATPEVRGDGTFAGGLRAGTWLLASVAGVTAIACYNDMTAMGVIRAQWLAGLRVPDDVSVIGFDDIAASAWTDPALTTITQETAALGRLAVERLIGLVAKVPAPTAGAARVQLPMTLQVRESTAPPRYQRPLLLLRE